MAEVKNKRRLSIKRTYKLFAELSELLKPQLLLRVTLFSMQLHISHQHYLPKNKTSKNNTKQNSGDKIRCSAHKLVVS